MKYFLAIAFVMSILSTIHAQEKPDPKDTEVWEPEPSVITPGDKPGAPPSDAIVLFDGRNLDKWVGKDGKNPEWTVADGSMTVAKGKGDIKTRRRFYGQLFLTYLMLYAAGRFALEFLRGDVGRGFVIEGLMSHSQLIALSVALVVATIVLFGYRKARRLTP